LHCEAIGDELIHHDHKHCIWHLATKIVDEGCFRIDNVEPICRIYLSKQKERDGKVLGLTITETIKTETEFKTITHYFAHKFVAALAEELIKAIKENGDWNEML